MQRWKTFLTTTVATKATMAVTGVALLLFVIAHLLGNLLIFQGQEAINAYAQGLRDLGPLLWIARLGLLVVLVLHVVSAVGLVRRARAARPVPYRHQRFVETSYAARTMFVSGVLVLLYALFHLMHFTWGQVQPEAFALEDELGRHDVYSMMVAGFQVPVIAIVYALAQAILAMHLSHGVGSAMHTLGVRHPALAPLKDYLGPALALVIFVGYVSIPAAVLLGYLT